MIKSGADICNEITSYEAIHEPSLNTKEYTDLVGEGYYLSSDVDKRIEIYDDYKENFELFHQEFPEIEMPDDITKHYLNMDFLFYWIRWLFVFCFGDMTEDFKVKIEKLEEKKI